MRISDWSSDVCSSDLRTLPSADVDRLPNDPSTLCEIPAIVPAMNERASVAPARVTTLPERPFLPSASTKKPLIAWSTTAWLSTSTQEIETSWISTLYLARQIGRASGRDKVCRDVVISVVAAA